jgi:hypothetical protein
MDLELFIELVIKIIDQLQNGKYYFKIDKKLVDGGYVNAQECR